MINCPPEVCLNYNYSSGCPVAHQKFRCQKYLPFVGTYSFVCVSLVQCVFAIRIYAIYGGKKLILIVFALFFVGELSLIAVSLFSTVHVSWRGLSFFFHISISLIAQLQYVIFRSELQVAPVEVYSEGWQSTCEV